MPFALPWIAASNSASANTMLGDLPPSSSVTRFNVSAPVRMMILPTSFEPVNPTLSTFGWDVSGAPHVSPNPVSTFSTPAGKPRLLQDLRDLERGQRRLLGGLQDHRAPGRDRRRHLLHGHHHRVVPRRDGGGHAHRLLHDERHRVGTHRRDVAVDLRRPAAVVLEHERDLGDVLAGLADRLAGVERFELRQALVLAAHDVGGAQQDPAALALGGPRPPRAVVERPPRGAHRASTSAGCESGAVAMTSPVAGLKTSNRFRRRRPRTSRRCSSGACQP